MNLISLKSSTFAGVEIVSISESELISELESGSSSNKKGLKVIFKDFLESNRRLEGDLLQVAVTKSVLSFKSVTPPSIEEVCKKLWVKSLSEVVDLQSVKNEEDKVIDSGSTAGGPR